MQRARRRRLQRQADSLGDATPAELRRWLLETSGVSISVGALWNGLERLNGVTFRAYIEQHLAPALSPGDLVVCDNLQCHKAPGVRAAIEARSGELRFLPPCSPDLSPIKQIFAKLKNLVRAAAPRDVETLWNCIGPSLDRFSSAECTNYIAHSGYPRMM